MREIEETLSYKKSSGRRLFFSEIGYLSKLFLESMGPIIDKYANESLVPATDTTAARRLLDLVIND